MLGTNFRLYNKLLTLPLLLVMALLFVACGGGAAEENPSEPANELPAESTATEAPAPAEEAAASEPTVNAGGTLRVAMQPIVNTDPLTISSDSEVLVANHVYDYLIDIDPQSNIIPRLATEWAQQMVV